MWGTVFLLILLSAVYSFLLYSILYSIFSSMMLVRSSLFCSILLGSVLFCSVLLLLPKPRYALCGSNLQHEENTLCACLVIYTGSVGACRPEPKARL